MRAQRIFLLALMIGFLAGCATTVRYTGYTEQRFPPKPGHYFITVYPAGQKPPATQLFQVIGKMEVAGQASEGVTPDTLMNKAKAVARQKGADAIMNVGTEGNPYSGVHVEPGYTSYHPVIVGEGSHRHGGFRAKVYVPQYHPTTYTPYADTMFTLTGELIVFPPQTLQANDTQR